MTSLYAISDGKLRPAVRRALSNEKLIEDWVEADPEPLGPRRDDYRATGANRPRQVHRPSGDGCRGRSDHHRVEKRPHPP